MFRFAKAVDLHDEASWSAWGTRRRRLRQNASGSQLFVHALPHAEQLVVWPTNFVRPTEAASGTPKDCADSNAAFFCRLEPPRGPREHLNSETRESARRCGPRARRALTTPLK